MLPVCMWWYDKNNVQHKHTQMRKGINKDTMIFNWTEVYHKGYCERQYVKGWMDVGHGGWTERNKKCGGGGRGMESGPTNWTVPVEVVLVGSVLWVLQNFHFALY